MKDNFFQSPELREAFNNAGLKTVSLTFPGKSARGFLLAHSYDRIPLYSTFLPRFEVFYGPAVGDDLNALNEVLERLCRLVKDHLAVTLFVRTPFPFPFGYEIFKEKGFERTIGGGEFSVLIDLKKDQIALWKDLRESARYCVRKALKENVKVRGIETESELLQFYNLYLETAMRRGFYPYPYDLFYYLWRHLEPKKIIKYFLAYFEGKPIGGIVNTIYQGQSVPWFACSLPKSWRLYPNHLLFWHSIDWSRQVAHSSLFKIYHLPNQRRVEQGVDYYTFKTSFGGTVIEESTFYQKVLAPIRYSALRLLKRVPKHFIVQTLISNSKFRGN